MSARMLLTFPLSVSLRGAHIDMNVFSDSGPSLTVAQRTLHAGELTLGSFVSNGRVLHHHPAQLTQRAYCAELAIRDHSSSASGHRAPDSRIDHTWEPETGIRSKHMTSICEGGVRTVRRRPSWEQDRAIALSMCADNMRVAHANQYPWSHNKRCRTII